jgi:hypothetical protein
MSGERCSRRSKGRDGPVRATSWSGGADFLQSRPRLSRSRVASLQQLLGSALVLVPGAGAGLMQRKLPGLARGLRIGALLVLAVLCC